MLRPTDEQLALLEGFERKAFALCDTVNRVPALKTAAHAFLKTIGKGWVHYCTRNILHVYGQEHLDALHPDRGVMIAANHRSFFDMYVITSVMLRRTSWIERMYFPVRGDFWYQRPDGVAANAVMSALAMYPPVLRQPEKRAFNQYTVDFLTEVVDQPGTVVGMHPEGTRNKTDDPYTLLPAQPGIGQIVRAARPIVLPVFILGLGNDLPKQVKGNFDGTGEPITVVFGKPLELQRFFDQPPRLRTYMAVATHLRDELTKLGQVERAIRKREGFPDKSKAANPHIAA
jgi:1-acyl-sn-glycerol-3-phosphate acyltransferase